MTAKLHDIHDECVDTLQAEDGNAFEHVGDARRFVDEIREMIATFFNAKDVNDAK